MRAVRVCSVLLTLAIRVCVAQTADVVLPTCTKCNHGPPNIPSSPHTASVNVGASAEQGPRIAALLQQDAADHADEGPLRPARQLAQTQSPSKNDVSTPQQQQHGDHKPLFPVSGLEVAVLVIAGVVLFIAAGAGMGGGPVLVPLYLVAGLNNTAAVALSNSTILAGSVGNTLVNIFKRHPYKNKPMIDWDLVLLMEPPTLIGAIAGSYINKLLPTWITSVLLVLLLALMTVRVAQRAARIYTRESATRREEQSAANAQPAAPQLGSDRPVAQAQPAQATQPNRSLHSTAAAAAVPATPKSERLAGSNAVMPVAPTTAAAATAAADGADLNDRKTDAGVEQLLAEERAAHVGPSDQPSSTVYNSSGTNSSYDSRTAANTMASQQQGLHLPQQQRPHVHGKHKAVGSAGASPFASTAERPASPMGRAESAPHVATGHASPYRSPLSTVPSSVLLNLELEGNISEAALHRLAMHEQQGGALRVGAAVSHVDASDASLASMDGVSSSSHSWWWWQPPRQQHQQQGEVLRQRRLELEQQHGEEPPSEAECRLLYAPPDHTRRDSWELAWEDDEQQQAAHSAGLGGSLIHHSTSPTPALGTSILTPDSTRPQGSRLHGAASPAATGAAGTSPAAAAVGAAVFMSPDSTRNQGPRGVRGTSPGSATGAGVTAGVGKARLQATVSKASGTAAGAPGRVSHTGSGTSTIEMVSASPHQHAPAAAPSMVLPPAGNDSRQQQRPGFSRQAQQQAPEVAASNKADAVASMLAAEAAQVPLLPAALLLVMFLAVLLSSLFSKMAPCGSAVYWIVQWSVAPVLLGVWWYSRRRVLAKVALKKEAQLDFHGEVRWTPRKSLVFPAICSIAGIIAGMFGLGGAVVKTPLMLELGVHPSVTAATTQTMLLLTSSASSIVYAQLGDTPWDWATVMLPMAFAATLAGQAAIDWLVKKVGRSSMVVLVLAAFFIVATCLSIYTMALAVKTVAANPALVGKLGKICR